ncbi:hypothetical protein C4K26_4102 [Pseudomonas chlororaphis]|uniref:hypothetical protein n=1 Tax=Pseudomonas chlororaphis TaxID=587753 RepID=UPI000F56C68F|nr:hypothetical protein [Pseudomonas chlororaphis]AZD09496.1 hypothetical protein C4K26_4102 [Pseudomonas chlororaphis]
MSLNTADKIFLVVVDFAGIFMVSGIYLHMAYTKMDLMLDHLKNSAVLSPLTTLRHGGPWGKLLLIGGISGIVTFPGFYLKRGELSAEDLNNFPLPFKRKLAVLQWSVIGLLGFAALLWVIGKVVGWHQ